MISETIFLLPYDFGYQLGQNLIILFSFTPLLCAKQNKQYYAHWLKNKPVESVIASRTEYAT
jgi:hypothetical protein